MTALELIFVDRMRKELKINGITNKVEINRCIKAVKQYASTTTASAFPYRLDDIRHGCFLIRKMVEETMF